MNLKNLISVAIEGLLKLAGLIGPPLYLDISLNAYTDRLNKGFCLGDSDEKLISFEAGI